MPKRKNIKEQSESTKSNYIKNFTPREDEILRRKLSGDTNKAIAEAMGLSETRVSFIVNSPLFQAKQTSRSELINSRFQEELATDPVKRIFQKNREKAAKKLVSIIDDKNASLRLQKDAAIDTLEFQGYNKKPVEDRSTNIYVDKRTSEHIYIALKALKIDAETLKSLNPQGVAVRDEPAGISRNTAESDGGVGKKELLDILQGDNGERLADGESPPSPV